MISLLQSSEEMYVKNVRRWLMPFLQRVEKTEPDAFLRLLRQYLVSMASTDLTLVLKMFETSKADVSNSVSIVKDIANENDHLVTYGLLLIKVCISNHEMKSL